MGNSLQKRYLVLARVGGNSLHRTWIADKTCNRTWDLQLNAFGATASNIEDVDLPTVIDQGTKWDSICRHINRYPNLLTDYDYIMFPDDDLLMTADDINLLFDITSRYDLTMSQPALSHESYISYPILLKCPEFELRHTNFLEAMSCCIKTSYFSKLIPMLQKHFTGWGTDLVWTLLMKDPSYRAAVIDTVSMTHTRPLQTGPFYKTLVEKKVEPQQEITTLRISFQNAPTEMLVYGGVLQNGRRIGATEANLRNGVHLLRSATSTKLVYNTARMGLGMLLRSVTRARYRPDRLLPVPGTDADVWFRDGI